MDNWIENFSETREVVVALDQSASNSRTSTRVPEEEVAMLDSKYDMSGEKIMIILNQRKFKRTRRFKGKPRFRKGANEDRNKLEKLFEKLGFTVIVMQNHQYCSIIEKLTAIAARDHTGTSCICVAILTRGGQGGQICAADRWYNLSEVMDIFGNARSLVDKPKIYFVQACRGKLKDAGQTVNQSSQDLLETDAESTDGFDSQSNGVLTMTSHADSLVLYACAEGHVSYRTSKGSWMIQALCRKIKKFHKNEDILDIINRVKAAVARKRTKKNMKQMPEATITLTKKLNI